ncbi:hypothetical protein [Elizabethkingia anophelis]|uniref:hypothetical protein n=1 Tax=Elizabethkingia anophelis TaxID=1117645 RepID=UPI00389223C0
MKAKYIIVNTEERLPTESDQYYTDKGKIDFSHKNGNFWDENDEFELYPNWWLEEKEDHSEEMLSLLEELISYEDRCRAKNEPAIGNGWYNKAKQLINKVKDNGK